MSRFELDTEVPIDQLLQATSDRVQQEREHQSRTNNDRRSDCACPGEEKSNQCKYTCGMQDQEQSRQEMVDSRAAEHYLC